MVLHCSRAARRHAYQIFVVKSRDSWLAERPRQHSNTHTLEPSRMLRVRGMWNRHAHGDMSMPLILFPLDPSHGVFCECVRCSVCCAFLFYLHFPPQNHLRKWCVSLFPPKFPSLISVLLTSRAAAVSPLSFFFFFLLGERENKGVDAAGSLP